MLLSVLGSKTSLLLQTRHLEEARVCAIDNLQKSTHFYGELSAKTAIATAGLAAIAHRLGDINGARDGYLKASAIYERLKLVGDSHFGPHFAHAQFNLGVVSMHQEKYAEALAYCHRSLFVNRKVLPPDHPDLARAHAVISQCNAQLGRSAAAETALSAASFVSRRSQTACAGPSCRRMVREDGEPLDQCAGCLRTYYCGKACQTADWKALHKKECKALAAEGATSAAAEKGGDKGGSKR